MAGRLVLLATSPRVAPGLLSGRAWFVLGSADVVLVGDPAHPLLPALAAAGVAARVVESTDGEDAASVRARTLLAELRDGVEDPAHDATPRTVVWVVADHGDEGLAEALEAQLAPDDEVHVELVTGSWDLPGARLLDLVAVMDRLRSPGGCPWDAEQTHESLVEYLVEEAYETVEAIETGDDDGLREELGDLLLQVVFQSRMAQEHEQPWGIDEVAQGIVDKLVARHPHVFADADASTAAEVEKNWQSLKNAEKGRESVTDGIPAALPSLVLAAKLLKRSRGVEAEVAPPAAQQAADRAYDAAEGELGDLLLALVARARADGVDLDVELRAAARRLRSRIRAAEGLGET
ncbi:MAG: MazG family protein [Candidatus Nanopelagicales bacterium]